MSQRMIRVNELMKREISDLLHSRWQTESVRITITAVDVTSDLRTAQIYYSVLGTDEDRRCAKHFIGSVAKIIRREVSKLVILKYTPYYVFIEDKGVAHGVSILNMLDKVAEEDDIRDREHHTGNYSDTIADKEKLDK